MQKSTFKIATKFSDATRTSHRKPIEYTEVEGFVVGNWGITDHGIDGNPNAGGDGWVIYHIVKGLRLSYLYFEWDNAVKILQMTTELFGENNDGEPTSDNHKKSQTWEREAYKIASRDCLYFDDDDDCDGDDD
jgi:hypothetical protein